MTNTELNIYRRALRDREAELGMGNLDREAFASETSPDELDRIQYARDRDFTIGSLERNRSRLSEVRNALHRVDAGTFGTCEDCEEAINPRRLAAIPWASSCIACQEAMDHLHQPLMAA